MSDAVLSKEQVAKIRALRSLDPGKIESFDRIFLCDSHEALRAEVARLRGQLDCVHPPSNCSGGNDYIQCQLCGRMWDYRVRGNPDTANQWAARDTARAEGGDQ